MIRQLFPTAPSPTKPHFLGEILILFISWFIDSSSSLDSMSRFFCHANFQNVSEGSFWYANFQNSWGERFEWSSLLITSIFWSKSGNSPLLLCLISALLRDWSNLIVHLWDPHRTDICKAVSPLLILFTISGVEASRNSLSCSWFSSFSASLNRRERWTIGCVWKQQNFFDIW